jgi:hypothetical protein
MEELKTRLMLFGIVCEDDNNLKLPLSKSGDGELGMSYPS